MLGDVLDSLLGPDEFVDLHFRVSRDCILPLYQPQ
jgi:hypothetical protein